MPFNTVPARQLLGSWVAAASAAAALFPGLTQAGGSGTPSVGVLKGWETPGVADDMADGTETSPTPGCRGAGGGGIAGVFEVSVLAHRN